MSSTRSDVVDLTLKLHHETERALLVSDSGDRDDAVWLAKSQIEFTETKPGFVEVTLPEWLATERKLV
jgi:hypothetical protein